MADDSSREDQRQDGIVKKSFFIALLFAASCINPYARFYQGTPDARMLRGYDPSPANLQIYRTESFEQDGRALIRKGYAPIGKAAFNIGENRLSEWQLREQAQNVGAHVVLIASKYTHTVSGAVPLFLPTTATAFTTGSATAYSRGIVATAYGSSTTTVYGTQTIMMPYSVAHFDVRTLFFAKTQPRLGIYPAPLDDATRKRLQTNSGVRVVELVEGSPAFEADIIPGDVLLAAHGEAVQSTEHFVKLVNKYEGESVVFKFDRDGKIFEKQLEIRALQNAPLAKANTDTHGLEEVMVQQQQQAMSSDSSPPPAPTMASLKEAQPNTPPIPATTVIPKTPVKTFASLVQYDGPKVKSGVTLEAEFIDDGTGSGKARVVYPGNRYVLDGTWTTLPAGKVEAPRLIEKKALNALRLAADVPLTTSRFADNETILECLHGETASSGQRKGECQDNFGNKYHLVVRP